MAYNLPPAWDPGFALPDNVRDEGLERRAFVTKWLPRGTYDQPRVGTGGYAVPEYVMDEGYGQGTFTTKWRPRGTYDIPVPHWLDQRPKVLAQKRLPGGGVEVKMAALSGTDLPRLYTDFGRKAAREVMRRVLAVPPAQRKRALKATLDAIDPTLWKRVAAIAQAMQKAGASAAAALEPALAEAMSTGIAAEIVKTGLSRSAPQPHSLLGLGCYRARARALGAVDFSKVVGHVAPMQILTQGSAPSGPSCYQEGFAWDAAGKFWRRLKVGEAQPQPVCGPGQGPVTSGAPGGGTVEYDKGSGKIMRLGPSSERVWFEVPVEQRGVRVTNLPPAAFEGRVAALRPTTIAPEIWADIVAQMRKVSDNPILRLFGGGKLIDGTPYGLTGQYAEGIVSGEIPLYSFEHPEKGRRYGLYAKFDGTKDKPMWLLHWKDNEPTGVQKALSYVRGLVASIVDLVEKAVDIVADLACKVASSPNAQQAGATAGVAAGAGAAAGAAGAEIAKSLCGGGAPPAPIVMPAASSAILPLAIAGGVVLVALALKKKKKTP